MSKEGQYEYTGRRRTKDKMDDPYRTLNVNNTVTPNGIKRAYRDAARKAHPDQGGSIDAFDQAHKAYLLLSDPEARDEYDRTGQYTHHVVSEEYQVQQGAIGLLGSMFNMYLSQASDDMLYQDCTEVLRQTLDDRLDKLEGQLDDNNEKDKLFSDMKGRLRFTGQSIDVMGGVIKGVLDSISKARPRLEFEIKCCKVAIEMLEDYKFNAKEDNAGPWVDVGYGYSGNDNSTTARGNW